MTLFIQLCLFCALFTALVYLFTGGKAVNALFSIAALLKEERQRCIYRYLTAFSLTPWLALHLFTS